MYIRRYKKEAQISMEYMLLIGFVTVMTIPLIIIYFTFTQQSGDEIRSMQVLEISKKIVWHKVLSNKSELPEGRVKTVTANHKGICLTHFKGKFSALDNRCPHQGGPLGEGSIENGLLRCPWHGWDFDPCTGNPPGYDDGVQTFPVKEENDAIFVGVEKEVAHETTVSDIMVETMINWGVTKVFGMVGHSNLGFADAMRRQEEKGNLNFYGIRHEGAAAFAA